MRKTHWYVFIAAVCFGVARLGTTQTTSVVVEGVVEPPELLGPVAKMPTISESDEAYANAFVNLLKDMKMNESDLPAVNKFIHEYPENDVAYFWRANIEACVSKPPNLVQAKHDLETYEAQKHSDIYPSLETESLSLLAKMEVANGHSSAALDLMGKAVTLDLGDSKNIFNTGGVKPETTSEFCTWNLTDLNLLASGAPASGGHRSCSGSTISSLRNSRRVTIHRLPLLSAKRLHSMAGRPSFHIYRVSFTTKQRF